MVTNFFFLHDIKINFTRIPLHDVQNKFSYPSKNIKDILSYIYFSILCEEEESNNTNINNHNGVVIIVQYSNKCSFDISSFTYFSIHHKRRCRIIIIISFAFFSSYTIFPSFRMTLIIMILKWNSISRIHKK